MMNSMFNGIDWATYTKAKTSREELRHMVNRKIKNIDLFDDESEEEVDESNQEKKPDEKKEEPQADALKKEAEEK